LLNYAVDYLADLRTNRPARPTGARPPPPSTFKSVRHSVSNIEMSVSSSSSTTPARKVSGDKDGSPDSRSSPHLYSSNSHRKTSSVSGRTFLGRPLVRPLPIESNDNGQTYQETCGARWVERQEARSVRAALQEMDITGEGEENQLYEAASKEVGELVWRHQNGETAAFQNPDLHASSANAEDQDQDRGRRFTAHLEKGSHARSLSRGARDGFVVRKSRSGSRSASGSSTGSGGSSRVVSDGSVKSLDSIQEGVEGDARKTRPHSVLASNSKKDASLPPEGIKSAPVNDVKEKPSKKSPVLSSAHFRNPFARVRNTRDSIGSLNRSSTHPSVQSGRFDKIEIQRNPPTQSRNPLYTTNHGTTSGVSIEPESNDEESMKMKDGKEIRSDDIRKATSMSLKDRSSKLPMPSMVSDSPGRPIVSFEKDWKLKEIKLEEQQSSPISGPREAPMPFRSHIGRESGRNSLPTAMSPPPTLEFGKGKSVPLIRTEADARPLPRALPKTIASPPIPVINIPDEQVSKSAASYSIPVINLPDDLLARSSNSASKPPIPTINFPDDPPIQSSKSSNIPTISVGPPSINISGSAPSPPLIAVNDTPTINISIDSPTSSSTRPLPKPGSKARTFRPTPSLPPSSHSNLSGRTNAVLCHSCAFPIAGRIVTAAGGRFHPECFRCYHCSEALECVAFYPEPEGVRAERSARIQKRMTGELGDQNEGMPSAEDDGDEREMRFYCHLDFHEFFSPRCKSCKTPIEGDVVVACGAEWHAGHFFCAQCGDVSISYISQL
jgi:LIM domain